MDRRKISTAVAVVGTILLILVLITSGVSSLFTPRAVGAERLRAEQKHSGGVYRPYVAAEFEYVTFSGLYLTGDEGQVECWVMWGFTEDAVNCFFLKADGRDIDGDGRFDENDAPLEEERVEYILRAPQPSYGDHSGWALNSSVTDTASYHHMSESNVRELFSDTVLEAGRQSRSIARIGLAVGALLLAAGVVWSVLESRRTDGQEPDDEEREYYRPPAGEDELEYDGIDAAEDEEQIFGATGEFGEPDDEELSFEEDNGAAPEESDSGEQPEGETE